LNARPTAAAQQSPSRTRGVLFFCSSTEGSAQ
jgi:hypothetical protein